MKGRDATASTPWVGAALSPFLLAGTAASQTVKYDFHGPFPNAQWGWSVDGAGDVNGDGYADVVVGTVRGVLPDPDSGTIRVYSGSDGRVLHHIVGTGHDVLGYDVAGAGDVDADGFSDLVAGAPGSGMYSEGRVVVFSGLDGHVLHAIDGAQTDDEYARAVAGAGDVDADGHADFIVGAYGAAQNGALSGAAFVYSGSTGELLYMLLGDGPGDWFGQAVAGTGDVNGDGNDDFVVGAHQPGSAGQGYARIFSGATGDALYTLAGSPTAVAFGWSVEGAGDVNGDAFGDVIVGDPGLPPQFGTEGAAFVYSGADGVLLLTVVGDEIGDEFGFSVDGVGDIDHDGFGDLIVGARSADASGNRSGLARVFSGADGRTLFTIAGESAEDHAGWSCAGAGDCDLDGFPEVIVGAIEDVPGGAAKVISPCPLPPYTYCLTTPNSQTFGALIGSSGPASVAATDFHLTVVDAVAMEFGIFFYGAGQEELPYGDGRLCVAGGPLFRLLPPIRTDGVGAAQFLVDFTAPPVASGPGAIEPGSAWNFQFWYRDPAGGPAGFNFSDALSATFCP